VTQPSIAVCCLFQCVVQISLYTDRIKRRTIKIRLWKESDNSLAVELNHPLLQLNASLTNCSALEHKLRGRTHLSSDNDNPLARSLLSGDRLYLQVKFASNSFSPELNVLDLTEFRCSGTHILVLCACCGLFTSS